MYLRVCVHVCVCVCLSVCVCVCVCVCSSAHEHYYSGVVWCGRMVSKHPQANNGLQSRIFTIASGWLLPLVAALGYQITSGSWVAWMAG